MSIGDREIEKSTKITTNCFEICLNAKVIKFNDFTKKD